MHHPTDRITHTTAFVTPVVPWSQRSLRVQWIVGSILHGGPIKLLLVPASAPRLVLSCLWDDAYQNVAHVAPAGFLSRYMSGHISDAI